ncbi:MAG: hypothetical protein U1C56_02665 [Candidatus Curtissbacteria bacterium]|nr:hypothetical protein [Candidatus Curtissbacteria bacterium]
MKLQLDTTRKTIKIEENVKLSTLVDTLDKLLPNKEWKEFTLETNSIIKRWVNPIIYKEVYPIRPWWESPWICYSGTTITNTTGTMLLKTDDYTLNSGVYNIEI